MLKMIKLDKGICTGCEACISVCPVEAIDMTYDNEGFYAPVINFDKCISCRKCDQICLQLHEMSTPVFRPLCCYAANGNDRLRAKSSSGGAFSIIAEEVLNQNGIVWGAAYAEDNSVHHIDVDKIENLHLLQTSKYVQSRIKDGYKKVLHQLNKSNQMVLFSGTPCEIYALRMYLGKLYNNLICVDILCHGVPSSKDWLKYLKKHYNSGVNKIENINFRDKKYGWNYALYLSLVINGICKRERAQ